MTFKLPDLPIPDEALTPERIAQILDTAAALIEHEGLHTGDWWEFDRLHANRWTPGHCLCAAGAIGVAAGFRTEREMGHEVTNVASDVGAYDPHPAFAALMEHLGFDAPEPVFAWSDDAHNDDEPGRVTQILREVAAAIRKRVTAA